MTSPVEPCGRPAPPRPDITARLPSSSHRAGRGGVAWRGASTGPWPFRIFRRSNLGLGRPAWPGRALIQINNLEGAGLGPCRQGGAVHPVGSAAWARPGKAGSVPVQTQGPAPSLARPPPASAWRRGPARRRRGILAGASQKRRATERTGRGTGVAGGGRVVPGRGRLLCNKKCNPPSQAWIGLTWVRPSFKHSL